jgi:hypothetical protein
MTGGAVVVALLIVYLLFFSGGGSAAATPGQGGSIQVTDPGPNAAALASNAAIVLGQIQANEAVTLGRVNASTQSQQLAGALTLGEAQVNASKSVSLAQINSANLSAKLGNAVSLKTIAAQKAIALGNLQAQKQAAAEQSAIAMHAVDTNWANQFMQDWTAMYKTGADESNQTMWDEGILNYIQNPANNSISGSTVTTAPVAATSTPVATWAATNIPDAAGLTSVLASLKANNPGNTSPGASEPFGGDISQYSSQPTAQGYDSQGMTNDDAPGFGYGVAPGTVAGDMFSGAKLGAILGPIGAAVGAIVGGVSSVVGDSTDGSDSGDDGGANGDGGDGG